MSRRLNLFNEDKDSKFPSDIMFYLVQDQEVTIDTLVKLENALENKAPKNPVLVTTCRYVLTDILSV